VISDNLEINDNYTCSLEFLYTFVSAYAISQ